MVLKVGVFCQMENAMALGDRFVGLTVPKCREISKKYERITLNEINKLLRSDIHEIRLIALLILVQKFQKSSGRGKNEIFEFYLENTKYVNNWDLVDLSADKIVGSFLLDKNRKVLYRLAESQNLWDKRIAIMSTFCFIKEKKEYEDTFKIAEILLSDKQDLIQKAVGWMIREVGKRISQKKEQEFLDKHYKQMPRTMLRYAVERFPENLRKQYLDSQV